MIGNMYEEETGLQLQHSVLKVSSYRGSKHRVTPLEFFNGLKKLPIKSIENTVLLENNLDQLFTILALC